MIETLPTIRLPKGLQLGKRGCCVPAAISASAQLVEGRDFVIEGYIAFPSGHNHQHSWMEINGILFDPSFPQFRSLRAFNRESATYTPIRVMGATEYRYIVSLQSQTPFWQRRVWEFGGRFPTGKSRD